MSKPTSYTQVPRTTLWLLQGDFFKMGGENPDSQPHFTAEARSFYIGKTVITNEQFEAFRPDHIRATHSPGDDDPAVGVSYEDASGYCSWYSDLSKKNFRLPTEIEWEFACRGQSEGRYFFEDDDPARYIWSAENSGGRVHPAESLKFNPAGLYGMLGNVWEWTSSFYQPYPLDESQQHEAQIEMGKRVIRGGSFRDSIHEMSCGMRRIADERTPLDSIGFRIIRSL